MKLIFIFCFLTLLKPGFCQSFSAPSLNADMHNLYNAYLQDFKNIWGTKKASTETEIIYYSNYKVTGSVDSLNFVIYNKADRSFSFSAVMDPQFVNATILKDAFNKVQLSTGKLETLDSNIPSATSYTLADKKVVPLKSKKFTLLVSNADNMISDDNGRQFSFKIMSVAGNTDK